MKTMYNDMLEKQKMDKKLGESNKKYFRHVWFLICME